MEALYFLFYLTLFCAPGVLAAVLLYGSWRRLHHGSQLRRFGSRAGRRLVSSRAAIGTPQVAFELRGYQVEIAARKDLGGTLAGGVEWRLFLAGRNASGLVVSVVSRDESALLPDEASPAVLTGDAGFDERFEVRSNDAGAARALLNGRCRMLVRQLLELHRCPGVRLHLGPDWLVAGKERAYTDAVRLEQAWAVVGGLFDALLEGLRAPLLLGEEEVPGEGCGIQLLPASPADPAGRATCQVCGGPYADDQVVRCVACSTPHHRDCWEYVGHCATYGCSSTRAR